MTLKNNNFPTKREKQLAEKGRRGKKFVLEPTKIPITVEVVQKQQDYKEEGRLNSSKYDTTAS